MTLKLVDLDTENDWPELAETMLECYESPKEPLYDLFFPVLGDGPDARRAALEDHAKRLREWYEHDPDGYWHKVVDTETNEMIAAALWRTHHENPFTEHEDHTADYFPEGSQRNYVTQAIEQMSEPRTRLGQRPHLFLNIIWTQPRHRHRGAANMIMNWGVARAAELNYEMFLDAFPHARHFYPRYGFGVMETCEIHPHMEHPDAEWKQIERQLSPLTTYVMWRPKGGPYVEGQTIKPWETSITNGDKPAVEQNVKGLTKATVTEIASKEPFVRRKVRPVPSPLAERRPTSIGGPAGTANNNAVRKGTDDFPRRPASAAALQPPTMHDDPAFYSFAPSWAPPSPAKPPPPPPTAHRRRASLLAQPSESSAPNGTTAEDAAKREKEAARRQGPPKATVARRAQSYSDFHYAVTAILEPEAKARAKKESKEVEDKIKDDLDFSQWYDEYEDELLEASLDEYTTYLNELRHTERYLDAVAASTGATLDLLSTLHSSFRNVGAQTTAFRQKCQDLVNEQSRLDSLADGIGENLQYYSYLEPITRKLNAPGAGSFVRGKEFSDMLARLDECLDYMINHPSQREAATYRSRYRLLLTRGLTLIRVNFIGAVRDIAADVSKRIVDKQLNDTTMSALLYAKFRVGASELKALAQEIRKRAVLPADAAPDAEAEYQSLMNELYDGYSATRGKLILPLIQKRIGEIAQTPSSASDLVALARSSIGYVRGVCEDEHGLWREWFEDEDGLYDFLETICEPLHDYLRPRIIHETQLLKLCELCTLLQTRYFQEPDEDDPDAYEQAQAGQSLDFAPLVRPALEDTQTRIVFRAQAILRDEIEYFKPAPKDLDYPACNNPAPLSGTRNGPVTSGSKKPLIPELPQRDTSVADSEDPILNGKYDFDIEKSFQNWYPTLRKAIWLLSRIYRLVNSTVFDDLAHQIVHQTTLSLQRAAVQLKQRTSETDAQLFLLKHLLLLKQQIVAFDIEFLAPDVTFDFSGVTSTFYELRERGALLDPRNLWRLVSGGTNITSLLPRVVANMLDAKAELDAILRRTITELVAAAAAPLTAAIPSTAKAAKEPPDPGAIVPAIQAATEKELPGFRSKLTSYLDDGRTRETLVAAVRDSVVGSYESWLEKWSVAREHRGEVGVRAKGKGREGDVWEASRFADWAVTAFAVGKGPSMSIRRRRLSGGSEADSGGVDDDSDGSGGSMRTFGA